MSLGPWGFSVAHILSRATCLIKDLTSSVCFPSISGNLERQGVGGGGGGERSVWVRGEKGVGPAVVLSDQHANGAGAGSV